MSERWTSEPSGRPRTMMRSKSLASFSRPLVITGMVSCVPGGAGSRPMRPAGFVAFCSCTAAATSDTVRPS